MVASKPEKDLKTRVRKSTLDNLIPVGAEHVFRRPKPEICWIQDGHIKLIETSWLVVSPIADPNLFLSFVRLGARRGGEYKDPSENRIKKWVGKYGLPAKNLPKRGTPKSPASMSVEQFRREVRNAWELWTIHKEVWAEDAEAIEYRLSSPRSRWDRDLLEGFESVDHKLARKVERTLYKPTGSAVLDTAENVLDEIATALIADVRPRITCGNQSWWCPDLLSGLYLQFALLRVGDKPKRVCKNCGTLFPLTRTDKEHCDEVCYRTAYNHRLKAAST